MAQVTEMESALRYAQETEERLQADKEELQRELQEAVASLRGVRSLPLPYVSSCGDVTSPTHCNGATSRTVPQGRGDGHMSTKPQA